MGGDYTRFTFDPRKTYNAVLRQQGRVGLDSDANEASQISDRHRRSEALDLLSVDAGAPVAGCAVPPSTPDAFRITPTGGGAYTIGRGRAWVDGIQVECFGSGAEAWDPVLAELVRPGALPGDKQPFDPAPEKVGSGTHLFYLDAWYREIDAITDPVIRDKALGGPDTATRLQTVWQVKALDVPAGTACDDVPPGWSDLTAPSAGRLTTGSAAPQPGDNPCILSPEGGYRGRENRLYRVEIHSVAAGGAATYKWSHDNGSVTSAVTGVEGVTVELRDAMNAVVNKPVHRLTVTRLGRDRLLSFLVGGWVEVLDERIELDPGRSGLLARVVEVDEAQRTLTLDRELPAGEFVLTDPEKHITRVRRWDQVVAIGDESAEPDGALTVTPGAALELEDGVMVTFSLVPAGGRFRLGDYWVFAARTADSSVELLAAAPPRGVHHHYARLAVAGPGGTFHDCRFPWPVPETCCCTVTVEPGDDVQVAVDGLPDGGGTVCLAVGEHVLAAPVSISKSAVTIRGCGRYTRVAAPAGASAFVVSGDDVDLERFVLDGEAKAPLVQGSGSRLTLRELDLGNPNGPLLVFTGVSGLVVADSTLRVGVQGGLDLTGTDLSVVRNRLSSSSEAPASDDHGAVHLGPGTDGAAILDNRFETCPGHAISLGGLVPQIVGGYFGQYETGFNSNLFDGQFDGFPGFDRWVTPFVRRVLVSRNRIDGAGGCGISSLWISRQADPPTASGGQGRGWIAYFDTQIQLDVQQLPAVIEDLTVVDNSIRDGVRFGPKLGARPDGAPYGGIVLGHANRLRIVGNEVTGNGAEQVGDGDGAGAPLVPVAGIYVQDVQGLEVTGNLVVDNGDPAIHRTRIGGTEGGLVALDVSVGLEWTDGLDAPQRPDGPASALIHGNRIESVRGLALRLGGDGPMQVTGNLFSRVRLQDDRVGGAIEILNEGLSPLLGPVAVLYGAAGLLDASDVAAFLADESVERGGAVQFSDNQLRYDQRGPTDAAVAILFSLDDVAFCDNRFDCRLPSGDLRLFTDALVFGVTARSQDNGLSETLGSALLSLLSFGLVQSTGTGNQGTHCILIEGGFAGQRADANNLALCCQLPNPSLLGTGNQRFPCREHGDLYNFAANADFRVGTHAAQGGVP